MGPENFNHQDENWNKTKISVCGWSDETGLNVTFIISFSFYCVTELFWRCDGRLSITAQGTGPGTRPDSTLLSIFLSRTPSISESLLKWNRVCICKMSEARRSQLQDLLKCQSDMKQRLELHLNNKLHNTQVCPTWIQRLETCDHQNLDVALWLSVGVGFAGKGYSEESFNSELQ